MASANPPLRDFDATFGFHEKTADHFHSAQQWLMIRHALRASHPIGNARLPARECRRMLRQHVGNRHCRTDDRLFPLPINGHLAMQGTRHSRHRQCRCR
ncbi:hypothetical protein DF142_08005 [Burkholderia cenocepacia]|nr:hypothetical protein DF142_08005 [Burkholderia cenocepacia]RQU69615.1 hypothetical protein DF140_10390 [Burkholderia cenocepacia]RQU93245.1 hypothetical protein DF040_11165 [Burkholderia cenocepacia]